MKTSTEEATYEASRQISIDASKMCPREMQCEDVDRSRLAKDRIQSWDLVDMKRSFRVA
jgi:hypothetical protein